MAPSRSTGPSLSAGLLHNLGLDNLVTKPKSQGKAQRRGNSQKEKRLIKWDRSKKLQGQKEEELLRQSRGEQSNRKSSAPSFATQSSEESETEDSFEGLESTSDDGEDGASVQQSLVSDKASRQISEKIKQDDNEIAELERKLGIKGRKNLPKYFRDDGLEDLLESLGNEGEAADADVSGKKKRKSEAEEWLRSKRKRSEANAQGTVFGDVEVGDEEVKSQDQKQSDDHDATKDYGIYDGNDVQLNKTNPKRENPYTAPVSATIPSKYVPPARRFDRKGQSGQDAESTDLQRVRRQAHHLVARLSDANMLTILDGIDRLYLQHPRQHVTDAVVDKLLEQVLIDGTLSSSVTILIAGFASAVYMVKGADFGAHFVQQAAVFFKQHYDSANATETTKTFWAEQHSRATPSKITLNLMSLMAELYNFRTVGPQLIYDYARTLLGNLTEVNTELLLRIFETSGSRLRQDDAHSLKDIAALIQPAVLRAGGEKSLSARARHMISRIHDLRKSDKKKLRDAEANGSAHTVKMRKILGGISTTKKLEATGPLHVSLADIEDVDKRGKWWLVGASWAGREAQLIDDGMRAHSGSDSIEVSDALQVIRVDPRASTMRQSDGVDGCDGILGSWGDAIPDVEELHQLAREQGMNTDTRRSIFVTLLSAADSKEAYARLLRLGLNKYEKREIANVLMRCVGSEQNYNQYYALIARQMCDSDRRMRWVFQVCLWRLFQQMHEPMFGELPDEDYDDGDDGDETTDLPRVVNIARMYSYLIARGCLGLDILKCLNLVRLQTKTKAFVEILLTNMLEGLTKSSNKSEAGGTKNTILLEKRFSAVHDSVDLRTGLSYFLDRVVRKSKLVNHEQKATIARAIDMAQSAMSRS